MVRKKELTEVLRRLQAARGNSDVMMVVQLLDLMYDDAKDELVDCGKDLYDTARATVRTIDRIRKYLTQPSFEEVQRAYKKDTGV